MATIPVSAINMTNIPKTITIPFNQLFSYLILSTSYFLTLPYNQVFLFHSSQLFLSAIPTCVTFKYSCSGVAISYFYQLFLADVPVSFIVYQLRAAAPINIINVSISTIPAANTVLAVPSFLST